MAIPLLARLIRSLLAEQPDQHRSLMRPITEILKISRCVTTRSIYSHDSFGDHSRQIAQRIRVSPTSHRRWLTSDERNVDGRSAEPVRPRKSASSSRQAPLRAIRTTLFLFSPWLIFSITSIARCCRRSRRQFKGTLVSRTLKLERWRRHCCFRSPSWRRSSDGSATVIRARD